MNLDYYIPKSPEVSFHVAGLQYIRCLKLLGWQVNIKYLEDPVLPQSHLAVIHPYFYLSQSTTMSFANWCADMKAKYEVVVAQEVADTTQISARFIGWANQFGVREFFLPSSYAIQSYKNSGIKSHLTLVPHGFEACIPSTRFDFLKDIKAIKSLSFVLHESHRKGFDLILSVLSERPDVFFVIKGPLQGDKPFYELNENVLVINHWLSPEDLASLYLNSDLLLSPFRGGAFELNCLEASCYGKPVIATEYGPVLDYLSPQANGLIPVQVEKILWSKQSDHCGLGADPKLEDVLHTLDRVVANYDLFHNLACSEANKLKDRYSWLSATEILSEALKKYETC